MKKLFITTSLLLTLLSPSLYAADPQAYVGAYATSNSNSAITFGLSTDYNVGGEIILTNNDVGGTLYLHTNPTNNLKLLLGVSSIPDTEIVNVSNVGPIQDSTNANALVIGADYKIFSIRVYNYTATHSITKYKWNKTTKNLDILGTGSTSKDHTTLWAGIKLIF